MRPWDPKDAGLLKLNKMIIDHLIRAGTRNEQLRDAHVSAYERFLFLMGITVAHELVHFFVGFLTGYDRPSTPEEVTYLPSLYSSQTAGGIDVGESGRAWEGSVFGGIVEVWENTSSPLGVYQARDLCIIDSNKMVRKVDHASVKRILALCLSSAAAVPRERRGPGVISAKELEALTPRVLHTVRAREFAVLERTLKEPSYLFVAA
ncbi:hypothetical protein PG996_007578 [Apiospora saccharicola]|uniref:Uncharacterized protein n=1 Tax=Apiospora saccharicola TaxID=335842 RepID=A0ABR1VDR5_9PEZI